MDSIISLFVSKLSNTDNIVSFKRDITRIVPNPFVDSITYLYRKARSRAAYIKVGKTRDEWIYKEYKRLVPMFSYFDRKIVEFNKIEHVNSILQQSRNVKLFLYTPFFVMSKHKDPAKGHEDYEGKVYYDEEWLKYTPKEKKKEVEEYIKKHKLLSVQSVVFNEPYIILRNNCKHYFVRTKIENILSGNYYVPGQLKHLESKTYEQLQLRKYKKRLIILRELQKSIPLSTELIHDITRTRRLVEKWS